MSQLGEQQSGRTRGVAAHKPTPERERSVLFPVRSALPEFHRATMRTWGVTSKLLELADATP